jgi:hypothetical protein
VGRCPRAGGLVYLRPGARQSPVFGGDRWGSSRAVGPGAVAEFGSRFFKMRLGLSKRPWTYSSGILLVIFEDFTPFLKI